MSQEELHRHYWYTFPKDGPHTYLADVEQSLCDTTLETWHLNRLDNVLSTLQTEIPGITTAFTYYGTFRSSFPWHREDNDLMVCELNRCLFISFHFERSLCYE